MEGIYAILLIISGILNIILFFKIWGMCNNVKEVKELLERSNTGKLYDHLHNNSIDALRAEALTIEEMIFCGKIQEAKENYKRLQFQMMKKEERHKQFGDDINYFMQNERFIMQKLEGLFEN